MDGIGSQGYYCTFSIGNLFCHLYCQLLKVLICPELLDYPRLPQDVKDKAKRILQATPGFDIGNSMEQEKSM